MASVPLRTCVACRTARPKPQLLRVGRGTNGRAVFDGAQRMPGRGAYVCATGDCWEQAVRRGALTRALRTTLRPEDLATLGAELEEAVRR